MITLIIVLVTSVFSIVAFNNRELFYKYQLNPYQVVHKKQLHRIISHAFLHSNWVHLIVNMLVLYSFGSVVEQYFLHYFQFPVLSFLLLYIGGIIIATGTTIIKFKNQHWYNAVGASGAVSAIVFSSIFFDPWNKIYLYGIIGIPGILTGILYLVYSYYMSKKDNENINHDAHFLGAIYGLLFPVILDYKLVFIFFEKLFRI